MLYWKRSHTAYRLGENLHNDNVNHPNHYTSGPFECIELTEIGGASPSF